jgi:hypothetical protein
MHLAEYICSFTGAIFDQDGNYALVPVVLYAIVVMTLNKTYRLIAEYLTELENHRLVREFENALILKRILFESFDCYAILFYIAFYQLKCQRLQTEVLALYTTGLHVLYSYKSAFALLVQTYKYSHPRSCCRRAAARVPRVDPAVPHRNTHAEDEGEHKRQLPPPRRI